MTTQRKIEYRRCPLWIFRSLLKKFAYDLLKLNEIEPLVFGPKTQRRSEIHERFNSLLRWYRGDRFLPRETIGAQP